MKKRIFALLMALCMIFGMTNLTAYAETYVPTTGTGTEDDPVVWDMGPDYTYQQEVAADTELYVLAYGMGTYVLTIDDADAYVIVDGVKHTPNDDGLLEVDVTIQRAFYFYIGNAGDAVDTFNVDFVAPPAAAGTRENPEELTELFYTYKTVELAEGNQDGYIYKYVAEGDGKVQFELTVQTEGVEVDLVAYNLNNYAQRQFLADSYVDEYGYTVLDLEVSAGDEVMITVVAVPDASWNIPAATVEWGGTFYAKEGTEANPYYLWDVECTADVPAGEAPYFASYGVGGTTLLVEGADVYVVYNGTTYNAENGAVEVELQNGAPGSPIMFQIGNKGEEDATYDVTFVYPEGTYNNPDELVVGKNDATFEANGSEYYYTWTAPADGLLTITVSSTTDWMYYFNNETAGVYGDYLYSTDDAPSKLVIEVKQGDEITGGVLTLNGETYVISEGTITTTVSFAEGALLDEEAVEDVVADIEDAKTDDDTLGEVVLEWYDEETGEATTTVLPGAVLEAAKENGVVLEVMMGLYGWVIDPTTISDNASSVNLEVLLDTENISDTLIDEVAGENDFAQFSLVHDGAFDFTAHLILPAPAEYAGKNAVLYWNNNGTLVKMGECKVNVEAGYEVGTVVYEFEHASDYVIVIEDTASTNTTNPGGTTNPDDGANEGTPGIDAPKTGDTTNFALWIAIFGLGVVAMAGSVVMRKREF